MENLYQCAPYSLRFLNPIWPWIILEIDVTEVYTVFHLTLNVTMEHSIVRLILAQPVEYSLGNTCLLTMLSRLYCSYAISRHGTPSISDNWGWLTGKLYWHVEVQYIASTSRGSFSDLPYISISFILSTSPHIAHLANLPCRVLIRTEGVAGIAVQPYTILTFLCNI